MLVDPEAMLCLYCHSASRTEGFGCARGSVDSPVDCTDSSRDSGAQRREYAKVARQDFPILPRGLYASRHPFLEAADGDLGEDGTGRVGIRGGYHVGHPSFPVRRVGMEDTTAFRAWRTDLIACETVTGRRSVHDGKRIACWLCMDGLVVERVAAVLSDGSALLVCVFAVLETSRCFCGKAHRGFNRYFQGVLGCLQHETEEVQLFCSMRRDLGPLFQTGGGSVE